MSVIYHKASKAKNADEISDLSEELEKTYRKYLDMTLDTSNAISKMQRDARNRIRDLFETNNKYMFNLYQSHNSKTGKMR